MTHAVTLKMMKAQKDAEFPSDLAAPVTTSFRTVLCGAIIGHGEPDEDEGFSLLLTRLKTYKVWHAEHGISGQSQGFL